MRRPGRGGRGGGRPALKGSLFPGALPAPAGGGASARSGRPSGHATGSGQTRRRARPWGRPGRRAPRPPPALPAWRRPRPRVTPIPGLCQPVWPPPPPPSPTGCLSTWAPGRPYVVPSPPSPGTRSACMCVCPVSGLPSSAPPPSLDAPAPHAARGRRVAGPQSLSIAVSINTQLRAGLCNYSGRAGQRGNNYGDQMG